MEISQEVKPLGRRIICFSVPIKRKLVNSGLYIPNGRKWNYSTAQAAWIVSVGPKCHDKWTRGEKIWVQDGFEIETSGLSLWESFRDDPAFSDLKAFVESVDGEVSTDVMLESSIIAVEDKE